MHSRLSQISLLAISTLRANSLSISMSVPSPKNIVVVGGGIQGTSVAYHISTSSSLPPNSKVTILEAKEPAAAASGKGGGFMARSWGDGSPTQSLHHLAFDMYSDLAVELGCKSYRKLPVLSVNPGSDASGVKKALRDRDIGSLMPKWLNGNTGRISAMGYGEDTAQITPKEVVMKMLEKAGIDVVLGRCAGIVTDVDSKVNMVEYIPRGQEEISSMKADTVVVSAGPWSCQAEDWFDDAVQLPMEGIKSTSIVWKKPDGQDVDATALFCGEDDRFNTHLEVYPRPDGTIYLCGIGGSDYITKEELKKNAFLEECNANPNRVDAASNAFKEMSSTYKNLGELDRIQACMRPCPPDGMPYMGAVPGYTGAYINAGHNCWGIAWAPACGKAISELVLDGKSKCVDISAFDPSRFTPNSGRGGRGRKRGGASVGEQW